MTATLALLLAVAGCTTSSPDEPPPTPDTQQPTEEPGIDEAGELDGVNFEPAPVPLHTTATLVRQAQEAGNLDEPTALLYRTWGQFNDPRLPEKYRGEAPSHDGAVLTEVREGLDSLPADVAAELAPYLRRPSDPDSAFSGPVPGDAADSHTDAQALGPAGASLVLAAQQDVAAGDPPADRQCTDGWETLASEQVPVRAWVCKGENAGGAGDETKVLEAVIAVVDAHVPEMVQDVPAGMGAFIRDDPSEDPHPEADDRIDIYVVDNGWFGPSRGSGVANIGSNDGLTVSAAPYRATTSSGYILLDAGLVDAAFAADPTAPADDGELARTVVHEVFHVLQNHHNYEMDAPWWREGTATWAEVHFVAQEAAARHAGLLGYIQPEEDSILVATDGMKPYATYLWPLFMEQEAGAESVFDVWHMLESSPGTTTTLLALIGRYTPVEEDFAEFVMRMLNVNPPGRPVMPRFVHQEPDFPDGILYGPSQHQLGDDAVQIDHSGLAGLGHQYHVVRVDGPTDRAVGVRVTAELADSGLPTVEAVVRDDQNLYHRRHIQLGPEGTEFCVSGELFLVVSNSQGDSEVQLEGGTTIERSEGPVCDLVGDLMLELDGEYHGPPTEIPFTVHTSVHWRGALEVELVKLQDESDDDVTVYSGEGSKWLMNGTFEHERCAPSKPDVCAGYVIEQYFEGDAELAGEMFTDEVSDEGWPVSSDGWLRAVAEDGGVRLEGALPVTVTTTDRHPNRPDTTTTTDDMWPLECHTEGRWLSPRAEGDQYTPPDVSPDGTDLTGRWADSAKTEIEFDCDATWEIGYYDGGDETGSTSFSVYGTVRTDG